MKTKTSTTNTALIVIILLSLLALGGAMLAGIQTSRLNNASLESQNYKVMLENSYEQALFELEDSINGIENSFAKLAVSNSKATQISLLSSAIRLCDIASADLSDLPLDLSNTSDLQGFFNQVGGYSYALIVKLTNDKQFDDEDYQNFSKIQNSSAQLGKSIGELSNEVGTQFYLTSVMLPDQIQGSYFGESMGNIYKQAADSPKLIFDGPFSESRKEKTVEQDETKAISVDAATEKVKTSLTQCGYSIASIMYIGDIETSVKTYDFEVVQQNGREFLVYACICSGRIVLLSDNNPITDGSKIGDKAALDRAKTYAENLGYDDITPVFVTNTNGHYYVNLCPTVDGVIYYPALVKIKLAENNGNLVGFESFAYQCNIKNKVKTQPSISQADARKAVKSGCNILSAKLAVIPVNDTEKLAYEFICDYNSNQYYIYIDATDGSELEIMRVIEGSEGTLVD